MVRLSLSLLGPFRATLDGEPVTGFASNKVRALLAYLAVEAGQHPDGTARPHPRSFLAGLLWPDWPERSALANLRGALANLRTAIGDRDACPPFLLITRETVQFNRASDQWVDVIKFGDLIQAGQTASDRLEEALALYRGPFLESFSVRDSAAYEDWMLLVRERLQRQALAAFQGLVQGHEGRGEYERACELAWRWAELAPWQEGAHRALMRLLALSGQRGAALAQYEACRRALREELDVEPGAETTRLYERIRDGDLAPRQEQDVGAISVGPTVRPRKARAPPDSPGFPPSSHELPSPTQPPQSTPVRARPAPMQGERRIVTALLADVKGSTALAEQIDVERWVEIMDHVFQILGAEIYRYGGEIDQYRGDGLVAFFGLPIAHEDDPERAVLAALAIQGAVKEYAAELAEREGIDLSLRVGVNTGEVIAATVGERRHREEMAMGRAIALADRMEKACEPGTVLVTADTYRLVAPLFEWQALGKIAIKGVSQPLSVYRPLTSRAMPGKGRGIAGLESPLVGRDAEFRALEEAIERLRSGVGGIVTVVGEAGIGKSRLVTEIHNRVNLVHKARIGWLEGRCLSFASTVAYQVWLDVVRGLLEVAPDAPAALVRDALQRWVRASCPDRYEDLYPYMARMLSLSLDEGTEAVLRGLGAQGLKMATFRAVETLVERAARRRPLVLVCEDLHWADPTSLELLSELFPLADRAPLLLLCVFRPETERGCWQLKELAAREYRHRHTDLWLVPLSAADSEALVGNLLRVEDLPRALRARILDYAEGNPFFVEEILRSLIDDGIIAYDEGAGPSAALRTGRWHATRDVTDIPIPNTLHSALSARIDRLPLESKRVLQLASVIGRIFTYPVLSTIVSPLPQAGGGPGGRESEGTALDAHLVALQRAQLIRERARVPEREYSFKHHLTQQAAYASLLVRERRACHRQVAKTVERLHAERLEEQLGLLAHHWDRADEPRKAIPYLLRAGEQARTAYANEEAAAHFGRALALLDSIPTDAEPPRSAAAGSSAESREGSWRLQALKGLGRVYLDTGKIAESEACFREAIVLGRKTRLAARELVWLYHYLGEVLFWQSRWEERIRVGETGLALLGDDVESAEAALMNQLLAMGYGRTNNWAKWLEYTFRTANFIRRLPYAEELRSAYTHIVVALFMSKDVEGAAEWLRIYEKEATSHHDLRGLGEIHLWAGTLLQYSGDLDGAIPRYGQAIELCAQTGDVLTAVRSTLYQADTLLSLGRLQEAEQAAHRALEAAEALRFQVDVSPHRELGLLALCQGDRERAIEYLDEYVRFSRRAQEPRSYGTAPILLGHAYLAQRRRAEAAAQFEEALARTRVESVFEMAKAFTYLYALSGLEEACDDPEAYRALCRRGRAQLADPLFVQWFLEPADVGATRAGAGPLVGPPLQDDFAAGLSPGWTWHDLFGDCSYVAREGLEIYAVNGRDLWFINRSAPRVLRSASGDLVLQTTCVPVSGEAPAIGGLLLWCDERNYLRLDRGVSGEREVTFVGCIEDRDAIIGRGRLPPDASGRIVLRMERAGERVQTFCSVDGERWFTVGQTTFPDTDPVQVGLHAIGIPLVGRVIYRGAYPDGTAIRFESFQLWTNASDAR